MPDQRQRAATDPMSAHAPTAPHEPSADARLDLRVGATPPGTTRVCCRTRRKGCCDVPRRVTISRAGMFAVLTGLVPLDAAPIIVLYLIYAVMGIVETLTDSAAVAVLPQAVAAGNRGRRRARRDERASLRRSRADEPGARGTVRGGCHRGDHGRWSRTQAVATVDNATRRVELRGTPRQRRRVAHRRAGAHLIRSRRPAQSDPARTARADGSRSPSRAASGTRCPLGISTHLGDGARRLTSHVTRHTSARHPRRDDLRSWRRAR